MFQLIRSFDNKKMIVFPVNEDRKTFFLHTESGVQELPKALLEISLYPRADGKYYIFLLSEELNLSPQQAAAYFAIKWFICVVDEYDTIFKATSDSLARLGIELFGLL